MHVLIFINSYNDYKAFQNYCVGSNLRCLYSATQKLVKLVLENRFVYNSSTRMVSPTFPTQFELRCGGASLVIATILWIVAFWLEQIDHDLFAVATNESVIKLHDEISSPEHRFKVEVSCALLWISFPLLLAAVHVVKKLGMSVHHGTSGI